MNATTIELGDNQGIAITKNGKVIGFVKVKRERDNGIELVAYPVNLKTEYWAEDKTFNSFATTMTLDASAEEYADAQTFISALEF